MAAPARNPSPKDGPDWLSAAECASRTGLTVRALRVYEREGLINPPRSAKGWRRYGTAELTRLNTIVILKALGLTLAQIKAVLADNPPTLLRLLQVHVESWKEKRAAADRALTLLEAARARLNGQQTLSIDELCDLIKRLETNRSVAMKSPTALVRELINENTTPEEERVWSTWWAQNPDDMSATQAYLKEMEVLRAESQQLMDQGEDPGSPAMEEVLRRHDELLLRYSMRERNLRQVAWNREATEKWIGIGIKMRRQADEGRGAKQADFWAAAIGKRPQARAVLEVLLQIRQLMKTQTDPTSGEFDEPVTRLRAICNEYSLGDTLTLVTWTRFVGRLYAPYTSQESFAAEWELAERAVKARPTP
jgi:DNA-binding transcriptional MerR regulator